MSMDVGFIGLGRMGLPMASHVAAAGHVVHAVDSDPAACERARSHGLDATRAVDAVAGCAVVCSSLPDTPHVLSAYLDPGGVLDLLSPGAVCADLSTIGVGASQEVAAAAASRGIAFLDTPVGGTSIHAEEGTLAIMVGGDAKALERARPILGTFSRSIHHLGGNGDGLRMKLISNRLLASHLAAIAEAVIDLETAGLDVWAGFDVLRAGAVPRLLDYKAAPLVERDFSPQFTVDLMRKDLALAADELPMGRIATVARQLLETTAAAGLGAQDVSAIISAVDSARSDG